MLPHTPIGAHSYDMVGADGEEDDEAPGSATYERAGETSTDYDLASQYPQLADTKPESVGIALRKGPKHKQLYDMAENEGAGERGSYGMAMHLALGEATYDDATLRRPKTNGGAMYDKAQGKTKVLHGVGGSSAD